MKLLTLMLFFGLSVNAAQAEVGIRYDHEGVLKVEKSMELKIKSKKILLEPGSYRAKISPGNAGFFNSRDTLKFNIQTSQALLSGEVKFEKKTTSLQDLGIYTKENSSLTETLASDDEITESRSCVVYSFTTQENCSIRHVQKCSGINMPITGCSQDYYWDEELVCDTVTHEIKGMQNVTFKKTISTYNLELQFLDKKDGSVVAVLPETHSRSSEKIIIKTRCQ